MQGVREELLDAQAEAVGLPLTKVWVPHPCSNKDYEIAMNGALEQAREQGVTKIVFGGSGSPARCFVATFHSLEAKSSRETD